MQIVSVSLQKSEIKEIGYAMAEAGIKSRSKFFRQAINSLLQKQKLLSGMQGMNTVIFMITHQGTHQSDITSKTAGFEHIVKTVIHHHSKKGCLDILIAEGEANSIRALYKKILQLKGTQSISCSVI